MFLSNNKKNNVYPCKPKFYWIKVESFLGWVLLLGLFLYIILTIGQRFPPMKMCPFSYIPLKITKKNILITWTRMFPLAKNKGNLPAWFMIFVILCVLCFQRASFWLLFYSTIAGVVPCGGRKKSSRTSSYVILYFLWDHWAHHGYFENRISLKPALGGVRSLANCSVAYEEAQSNRVSDFLWFCVFFVSKGNLFWLLFYSINIFSNGLFLNKQNCYQDKQKIISVICSSVRKLKQIHTWVIFFPCTDS